MRLVLAVSGFVEVLARFLLAQRRLMEVGFEESESVQVVRGASSASGVTMSWYSAATQISSNRVEVEAVARGLQDHSCAEFEAMLPQTIALLLEFAPKRFPNSPGSYAGGSSGSSSSSDALTAKLAEALIRACGKSSQLGLETCWMLSDSAPEGGPFASRLYGDCWRAAARQGSRDTALLVEGLVKISETLAKVDRGKRREKQRLDPFLSAMNNWLLERAPKGVRLPLAALDTRRQIRVLRIDVDASSVMPSRARAPTLLFCEALDVPDDDEDTWTLTQKYLSHKLRGEHPMAAAYYSSRAPTPVSSRVVSAAQPQMVSPQMETTQGRRPDVVATGGPHYYPSRGGGSRWQQRPVLTTPTTSPLLRRIYAPCWRDREEALRKTSRFASLPGWRMASFLVKADDELRREILAMQAVRLLGEICLEEDVKSAWFQPYSLVCAGRGAGLVQTLPDAKSVDFVKAEFYGIAKTANLGAYFDAAYPDPKDRGVAARNFASSLASYSLLCYALDVKDRHNGNVLLDAAGHVVHIDFGYILGRTPGAINFEDAPFKLTDDYVDVMQGFHSPAWHRFVDTFTDGLHALHKHRNKLHALLTLFFVRGHSPRRQHAIHLAFLNKFNDLDGTPDTTAAVARGLIQEALTSERTKQYDWYQWKTNGYIM
mmetsp:Transcript_8469/g.27744  ORF Transcript_8469/g.27744 Transcript_8469/m.27744 type:complete len:657 (+) Transcript_8469:49-2019(+)